MIRKYLFAIGLIMIATTTVPAIAQNTHYGITAGLALSQPHDYNRHTGFLLGLKCELPFSAKNEYLYLGLSTYLIQKGWNDDVYDIDENKHNWKCDIYYIEIPVSLGFKYAIGQSATLFCEAGPYIGYGIYGKSKIKTREENYNENIFSSNLYKNFDYGLKISAGIGFSPWQLGLGIENSMQKPTKGGWNAFNPKDRSFTFSISYFIK